MEADTPIQAIAKLARDGKFLAAGRQFWVRIVIETENGRPKRAVSMPLTPDFHVPLDWQAPDDFREA